MMRIVFVVPYVPSLIRVRSYNLILALARRGHAVTVYTQWGDEVERADAGRLESMGVEVCAVQATRSRSLRNAARALPTHTPLQSVYSWTPKLEELLDQGLATSPPDVVHVEHLRGARYALHLKSQPRPFPVVWDSVDCISYLFEQAAAYSRSVRWRLLTGLELDRTRRLEALMRDRMDRTLVTSEIDRRAIEALAAQDGMAARAHLPVAVVPNGVDLNYFTPGAETREPDALVFSGKMSYHANVTAALYLLSDIMPGVWQKRPGAHLWIVGRDPTSALKTAAERYPGQVTVTGGVPDIRPYLQRATVSVAPIVYGAGIQLKLLEAMASGTPVVAARRATVALPVVDGDQVALFDDAAQAAERIAALLSQPEAAARMGAAGRRYVEQHHDWDAIAGRLEEIYGESIADLR